MEITYYFNGKRTTLDQIPADAKRGETVTEIYYYTDDAVKHTAPTKPSTKNTPEELRKQYKHETGEDWENSQGEPDIDYVNWLEQR